ncbi:Protein kinase domain containing protein [Entamoeba marina]
MSVSLFTLLYEDYFWYDVVDRDDHNYHSPNYYELKRINEFSDKENKRNVRRYHIDKPFYENGDCYYLKLRVADSKFKSYGSSPQLSKSIEDDKIPLLFISLQDIYFDDCDLDDFEFLRTFFLSEEWKQTNNFLRVYHAVIGECINENDNLTNAFWIICDHCYPRLLNDYTWRNKLYPSEIKFMTYDLLKIAKAVEKINLPCVIDKRTVMLTKDSALLFPKLMLSPLAFVIGRLNELNEEPNEEPLPQIGNLIEKLGILEENEKIIKELRANQNIENIMKLKQVKNLKYFVNGPKCLFHDYVDEKLLEHSIFGDLWKATDSNGSIVAIYKGHVNSKGQGYKQRIDRLKCKVIGMRLCKHNNIVKFISLAIDESKKLSFDNTCNTSQLQNVSVVMEYCKGGDLESFVQNYRMEHNDFLPLDLIGNIFYQIASVQHYLLFEKGIIYLHIKLEDFLIKYELQKIILFARDIILHEPHSYKSDKSYLFSLGLCLYYLLTSNSPFSYMSYEEVMIKRIPIKFPRKLQTKEYEYIIDLIKQLTEYDEDSRISWEELYEHPYMKSIEPC